MINQGTNVGIQKIFSNFRSHKKFTFAAQLKIAHRLHGISQIIFCILFVVSKKSVRNKKIFFMSNKGPISQFIQHHYRHFNAAALMDAAKGYETHLLEGGKMMVTLAGAMSTAELGISFAEMIRQNKVAIISCTGANLEEDIMNLVAHSHYKRVPNYRDLSPQEEWELLDNHYNRVTDTCIPEEEAFRRLQQHIHKIWKDADKKTNVIFRMNICTKCY